MEFESKSMIELFRIANSREVGRSLPEENKQKLSRRYDFLSSCLSLSEKDLSLPNVADEFLLPVASCWRGREAGGLGSLRFGSYSESWYQIAP